MTATVTRFFTEGSRTSQPMRGYVLWGELPPNVDSMKRYERALEQSITIGPGHDEQL